jgi:hypothetical protein
MAAEHDVRGYPIAVENVLRKVKLVERNLKCLCKSI